MCGVVAISVYYEVPLGFEEECRVGLSDLMAFVSILCEGPRALHGDRDKKIFAPPDAAASPCAGSV